MREEKWKDRVWRTHSCWTTTCSCNWVLQEHCLKQLLFTLNSKNCLFCLVMHLFSVFILRLSKFEKNTSVSPYSFSEFGDSTSQNRLVSWFHYFRQLSDRHCILICFPFFQSKRLGALNKFKSKDRSLLIATDVASRGLDIPHVDVVINFDIPTHSKVNVLTLTLVLSARKP